ncbi:MAG: citrate/2-methylcitrate synthase [Myxococcales bacterium]
MARADFMTAQQATRRLGVKPATLYTYVSRGWITRVPSPRGRGSLYLASDVERLKARHDARAGHTAVAASALRWGEPVIDSAVATIVDGHLYYRGHDATELLRCGAGYEHVAELLFTGELPAPDAPPPWRTDSGGLPSTAVRSALREGAGPIRSLLTALCLRRARSERIAGEGADAELQRARALIPWLASAPGWGRGRPAGCDGVAVRAARALGRRDRPAVDAVEAALILCADHELNASTFAARVTASAGSDLYACLASALATLSGPAHGGATLRVEALLEEALDARHPGRTVRERLARGERLPGFGHPLYPDGDPRAAALLQRARALRKKGPRLKTIDAILDATAEAGHPPPNLDFGLVALTAALDLRPSAAAFLFAVGRLAGWVAHILEQRTLSGPLRPRARYVGVWPGDTD